MKGPHMKKLLTLISIFIVSCIQDPNPDLKSAHAPTAIPQPLIEKGPNEVRDPNGEPLAPWEGEKILQLAGELSTSCPLDLGCGEKAGYIAYAGYIDSLYFYFSFRPEFSTAMNGADVRRAFTYMTFGLTLPGMRTDSSRYGLYSRDPARGADGITAEMTHTLQDFTGDTLIGEIHFSATQLAETITSQDNLCHVGDMMGWCVVNHPFSGSLVVRYKIKLVK